MNYHIVRTNDKIETIMNLYNLTKNEIKDLNTHITSWNNLIPGTRIKLPKISDAMNDELNDIEPFIEDYYPKIDLTKYESNEESVIKDEALEENKESIEEEKNVIYNKEEESENNIVFEQPKKGNFNNSIKLPPNYSYYYNPYEYYRYLKQRNSKKRNN